MEVFEELSACWACATPVMVHIEYPKPKSQQELEAAINYDDTDEPNSSEFDTDESGDELRDWGSDDVDVNGENETEDEDEDEGEDEISAEDERESEINCDEISCDESSGERADQGQGSENSGNESSGGVVSEDKGPEKVHVTQARECELCKHAVYCSEQCQTANLYVCGGPCLEDRTDISYSLSHRDRCSTEAQERVLGMQKKCFRCDNRLEHGKVRCGGCRRIKYCSTRCRIKDK